MEITRWHRGYYRLEREDINSRIGREEYNMAHDKQYKESDSTKILGFDFPKKGDYYYDRITHSKKYATEDMKEKFLILEEE